MDHSAPYSPDAGANGEAAAAYQRELDECLKTAITLHGQGHLDEAKQLYNALLSADPDHFDATRLLGVMANQLGQYAIACDLLARVIELQPEHVDAHYHYGLALQNTDQAAEAARIYATAFALAPDKTQIAENLAVALVDSGREDEAIEVCRRVLQLDASSAIAHSNLGTLYFNRGDTQRARHHFERLVELRPTLGQANEKLASVELREGRYVEGWSSYEWRFAAETFLQLNPPRHGSYPSWSGEELTARTILVTPEQGVGDEIMFASCIPDLIERAQHVVIQCDPRLKPLFQRSFPAATVFAAANPPDDLRIDCCVSAGSLPRFFRQSAESFNRGAFLVPDPERLAFWRGRLADSGSGSRIGISWRAGRQARAQLARSIDLSQWQDILAATQSPAINLQYGDHQAEIHHCESTGLPVPETLTGVDPLTDLDEFAALLVALDLVISVDNSTVHLAAALGVQTWVLLPAGAEWRWGDADRNSSWYDSARLYRQATDNPGDWQPVLAEVTQALASFTPVPTSPAPQNLNQRKITKRDRAGAEHALLLNDTRNWYHFGCTGTSLALHHQLRQRYRNVLGVAITATMNLAGVPTTLAGFKDTAIADAFCAANTALLAALANTDHVYVNGEGTLHDRSAAACSLLYLAWLSATRLNKPTSIINHSAYPGDDEGKALYQAVYRTLDRVAIREPVSASTLRELDLSVTDTFDCLPIYIDTLYIPGSPPLTSAYAVLAGGVTWHEGAAPAIGQLIDQLLLTNLDVVVLLGARAYPAGEELRFAEALIRDFGDRVHLVTASTESEWLDTIAGAKLLVSGRFHHSIAAAFLGTPLVASDSNTPKMSGLMQSLALPSAIQAPQNWASSDANRFAGDLCDRTALALRQPEQLRLNPDRRRTLLELAHRNFDPVPD